MAFTFTRRCALTKNFFLLSLVRILFCLACVTSLECLIFVFRSVFFCACTLLYVTPLSFRLLWRSSAEPGYVASISRGDQSSLERRVNFNELINPGSGPVDTTNVSLYEALKSVIEWTGQVPSFLAGAAGGGGGRCHFEWRGTIWAGCFLEQSPA